MATEDQIQVASVGFVNETDDEKQHQLRSVGFFDSDETAVTPGGSGTQPVIIIIM